MSATRARTKAGSPPRRRGSADEELHVLDTVERLKAMADPIRIRFVLELLDGPRTVKEVAEALDVPPTRLYYHLRILEENGLVEVANRRMVSGIEERSYRAAYDLRSWTVPPTLTASALYESGALRAMFDMVRAEMEVAVQGKPDVPVEDPHSPILGISLGEFALAPDELPRFRKDLERFLVKYGERARKPGQEKFRMFFALYPIPATGPSADGPD